MRWREEPKRHISKGGHKTKWTRLPLRECFWRLIVVIDGIEKLKCSYCNDFFPLDNMTKDHVIPVIKGGTDALGNIIPACKKCNHTKDKLSYQEYIMTLRNEQIYKERGYIK